MKQTIQSLYCSDNKMRQSCWSWNHCSECNLDELLQFVKRIHTSVTGTSYKRLTLIRTEQRKCQIQLKTHILSWVDVWRFSKDAIFNFNSVSLGSENGKQVWPIFTSICGNCGKKMFYFEMLRGHYVQGRFYPIEIFYYTHTHTHFLHDHMVSCGSLQWNLK